ncbi:MAG: helix-turn-helix protein [Thermomicrobiales bacterium]|nr:helix-turn-helix protein [Thermomicrobiales bacterium]
MGAIRAPAVAPPREGVVDIMKTLREWRAARLLSTKTLAAASGVSNKTIVQIENGRQLPTFRTMQRLSTALDVAPEEITEFAAAIGERGKDAA